MDSRQEMSLIWEEYCESVEQSEDSVLESAE